MTSRTPSVSPLIFFVTPSYPFFVAPSALIFVAPSGSEGSLVTCVPWQDKVGGASLRSAGQKRGGLGRAKMGARQENEKGARHGRWMSPSPQVKGLSLLFYPSC